MAVRVVCDDCGVERWYVNSKARRLENNGRCQRCITIERNRSEQGRAASSLVGQYKRTRANRHQLSQAQKQYWTPARRQARMRSGNPAWKSGKTYSGDGHVLVLAPNHTRAHRHTGYVFEHILVAEAMIGRPLFPNEVVHHDNEIKDDNRPKNLVVMDRIEHMRLHSWRRAMVKQCSR